VSFLLPADHGLDPKTTWVGLVQHLFGCLQCFPVRLSAFTAEPLAAPSPLLLPQQHLGNNGSSSSSADQHLASSTVDVSVGSQEQQTLQLQLVELRESTNSYTATIKLFGVQEGPVKEAQGGPAGSSGGSTTCSGLKAEPVVMVAGAAAAAATGAPTHEVVLRLSQPAGVAPFRLQLLHPVQANSAGGAGHLFWCDGFATA